MQHSILLYVLLHFLLTAYHSTHHHTLNLALSFICIILQSQLCIHTHHYHFISIDSHSNSHAFPHLPTQCNTIIHSFSTNTPHNAHFLSHPFSLLLPSPHPLPPHHTLKPSQSPYHPIPATTRHETPSHHSPFLHFLSLITDSFNPPLLSYVWTFLCRN